MSSKRFSVEKMAEDTGLLKKHAIISIKGRFPVKTGEPSPISLFVSNILTQNKTFFRK